MLLGLLYSEIPIRMSSSHGLSSGTLQGLDLGKVAQFLSSVACMTFQ